MNRGKQTQYDHDLSDTKAQDAIANMVQLGLSIKDACLACGISYYRVREWIVEGRQRGDPEKLRFVKKLDEAKARGIAQHAAVIRKAATGYEVQETRVKTKPDGSQETTVINKQVLPDWKASQVWLERRDPGNWGQKSTIQLNVNWEESLRNEQIDPVELMDSMMEKINPVLTAGATDEHDE